jgi:hypothetical protein
VESTDAKSFGCIGMFINWLNAFAGKPGAAGTLAASGALY